MTDPWLENAPPPPDREAQFAALLSHCSGLDATDRSHIMTAHQVAVTAAVTALLDPLAAEFDEAARAGVTGGDDLSFMPAVAAAVAFQVAAKVVRKRIPVPF